MNIVIITRHAGLVEWLNNHGITGTVITQACPKDIEGKDVIGNLPLALAALTHTITSISMNVPLEKRGQDLTPTELDQFGATLETYEVRRLK